MDDGRKRYIPGILVDTAALSREEWLDYRRKGIGGSDVAAIFGISPFHTGRDIYYEKTGVTRIEDQPDNWHWRSGTFWRIWSQRSFPD